MAIFVAFIVYSWLGTGTVALASLSGCSAVGLSLPSYCSVVALIPRPVLAVECTSSNITDLAFATRLSADAKRCIETLVVERGRIRQLRSYQFAGFDNLKKLSLNYVGLKVVERAAFSNLLRLERLELNGNNLESLPPNFVMNLTRLTTLHIIQSNLTQFPDLEGAKNLTEINLHDNLITTINSTNFDSISSIEVWTAFNLSENPLVCDCRLAWIKSWFSTRRLAMLVFTATCAGPTETTRNRNPVMIDDEDFICDVDECLSNNGGCSGLCSNTYGSYFCSCPPLFKLYNVTECGIPPKITRIDFEYAAKPVLRPGDRILLKCFGTGQPQPEIEWQFNGKTFSGDDVEWSKLSDETIRLELSLLQVDYKDSGNYTCILKNGAGQARKMIEVSVWPYDTDPGVASCSKNATFVTYLGEYHLPTHIGYETILAQPCAHGPKCSAGDSVLQDRALFACTSNGTWQSFDLENCQYEDKTTRYFQCLSQHTINQTNVDSFAALIVDATKSTNLDVREIGFAVTSLERLLANRLLQLSTKVVELILTSVSQLMQMFELSTCTDCSDRLRLLVGALAGRYITFEGDRSSLVVDNSQMYFEVFVVGARQKISASDVVATMSLEREVMQPASGDGSGGALPPNVTGLVAVYKNTVFFRHGQLPAESSSCNDDSCNKRRSLKEKTLLSAVAQLGLGSEDLDTQVNGTTFVFPHEEDAFEPVCVSWNHSISGTGGWSCDSCSLVSWRNNTVECHCGAAATASVLMISCKQNSTACDCLRLRRSTQAEIAVIGCYIVLGVLAIALLIVILTWIIRKVVSRSLKIHFNILLSLSIFSVSYLVSIFPTDSSYGGARISEAACKAVSSLIHFSLLVTVMWLTVEAYSHLSETAGKSETKRDNVFFLKSCLLCWGCPLLMVAIINIIGAANSNSNCLLYGATVYVPDETLSNGEKPVQICWIKNMYIVLGTCAIPALFLIVINTLIYCVVLCRRTAGDGLQVGLAISVNILLAFSWALAIITLSDHNDFGTNACAAFATFYYLFAVLYIIAIVVILLQYGPLSRDVLKMFELCRRQHVDDERKDETLIHSKSNNNAAKEKKEKGSKKAKKANRNRERKASMAYTQGAENIPLEELIGLMPFEMEIGGVQAAPPVRHSVGLSLGASMTETTLRIGDESNDEVEKRDSDEDTTKSQLDSGSSTESDDDDVGASKKETEESETDKKNAKDAEMGFVESGWASAADDETRESESPERASKKAFAHATFDVDNQGTSSTPDFGLRAEIPDPLTRQLKELDEIMTSSHASLDKFVDDVTTSTKSPARSTQSSQFRDTGLMAGQWPYDDETSPSRPSSRANRSLRKILIPATSPSAAAPVAVLPANRTTMQRVRRSDGTIVFTEIRQPRRVEEKRYFERYEPVRTSEREYFRRPSPRQPPERFYRYDPRPLNVPRQYPYYPRGGRPPPVRARWPEYDYVYRSRPAPLPPPPPPPAPPGYARRYRQPRSARPDYYEVDSETGKLVEYRYVRRADELGEHMNRRPPPLRRPVTKSRQQTNILSEQEKDQLMFFSGGDSNVPSQVGDNTDSDADAFGVWYQERSPSKP